jgi:ppGpp synthetase/RelA/SpoT-type nucleotidyltranferase
MKTEVLKEQYQEISGRADRMRGAIYDQFSQLIDDADVTLGVPMESRIKKWTSIENKLERKNLEIESILSLPDLVGVRAILLFRTDLDKIDELIRSTF